MDERADNGAPLTDTAVFIFCFKYISDCQQPGKVLYPRDGILLLRLLAVLAGAETFTDMARFGEEKLAPLRRM